MKMHLIAIGDRMPHWVQAGYEAYARRLPPECALHLVEIVPGRRGRRANTRRIIDDEGARALQAVPRGAEIIALEVDGRSWSTEQLADRMRQWLQDGRDRALLVGGPEGNAAAVREAANLQWSLSPLTLPHPLVRVLLAEQLYRAWSLIAGHPYHRA